MKTYETPEYAIECAYNNGYKKGYEDGKRDAVPVVHGRWIPAGKTEELAKCSVCGTMNHTLDYVFLLNMKYCPYCGAKMDGDGNG